MALVTDRYSSGRLATLARRRRAAHLRGLSRCAVADMDVLRARVALAEAERALIDARMRAGIDAAA